MGSGSGGFKEPEIKMLDIPKNVVDTWVKIPKNIEIAVFLDGRKFINPKNLQQMLKVINSSM
ncbi:MAG: hypothetical protein K5790_10375 [Nitrosopumilus sp.]|uniref:hypothetical protein n=1 Tax=Nitrosopumilus sp. TaxID=2024843 RepID=UPI00247EB272|nr:hypothetical protein [Nitrosopumilus sp.]MCV0393675.1 hypothetical protein [Nitrosopumilus sp.]